MLSEARRYFIGLTVSARQLLDWQDRLRCSLLDVAVKRWTHQGDGHITLHFLGQLSLAQAENLIAELTIIFEKANIRTLKLKTHAIARFPVSHPKVVAALIQPCDDLNELHEALAVVLRQLSLPVEDRVYQPHVTLARLHQRDYEAFQEVLLDEKTMVCASVCLYESTRSTVGARYRICRQWDLMSE